MSFCLRITNGDLVAYGSRFGLAQGTTKLEQLMSTWLLERWRSDRFHPSYGSVIDDFIGQAIGDDTKFRIEVEVRRVLGNFQKEQRRQFRETPSKFTTDELLNEVSDIIVSQNYDSLSVSIRYSTVSNLQGVVNQRLGVNVA